MDEVVYIFSSFRVLLTDNGKCFQSKILKAMAHHVGFKQVFTNPYTAETNGLTERFNKTLCEMLSHYKPLTDLTEWDKNVRPVMFAHNTSIQKTLKEVPYFLMFGRDPTLPQDTLFDLPSTSLTADL